VRSTLEWAQVRAMAADGVSQREIARRLGINRRTVKRMFESDEPPAYRRAALGSRVDRFEPVIRATLAECPDIKAPRMTDILRDDHGYEGSVDVVKRRLRELRRPRERPAQRTAYRPGQVLQLDWLELPTRPRIAGRERRVYALLGTLPCSAAQSAHFSFEMTCESFLEGHVRILDWLGGVPRECVYDNLRSVVARREREVVHWVPVPPNGQVRTRLRPPVREVPTCGDAEARLRARVPHTARQRILAEWRRSPPAPTPGYRRRARPAPWRPPQRAAVVRATQSLS
jgi:transposase